MKFVVVFLAVFAVAASQYVYESPAVAAVPEVPVYTYNSYAPYAYSAPVYSAYPYVWGYGSNKGADNKPAPSPSLTNNAARA
uniref:Uncharacterized protein n=1 Tax=Panagrolaimus sp. JU765 TaxID=591449 RepID=A0AC34Q6B7_9BILA